MDCLGNWFIPKDSKDKAYALIFGALTLKSFPQLVIPNFPTARAQSYEVEFEGLIFSDHGLIPKAPCDWRTWPGFFKPDQVACIRVSQILALNKAK